MSTDAKPKKVRKPKQQTAAELMTAIRTQPLAVKVELVNLLRESIDTDGKALQEQLALIEKMN
jgi:hypothetical protein